jgi:sterol desaturase/sphingolipid hydroxylase (fatty acid hydroxylase superfamily)
VVVFEVLLNAAALFNHANLHVPGRVERWLRLVVVTPDMHRVHHSIVRSETDSNFGFSVPWWDRAFGTYRAEPAAGHEAMTIGLERFRERGDQRLDRLLLQPLE